MRRQDTERDSRIALFNLLEEFVVRRTRQFIKTAYPEATIKGEKIKFPDRKLKTIRYDLEAIYRGIYQGIVEGIEGLNLAPYNLESYKKAEAERDVFELGRQEALVGIFKSRYLKRFESSVEAFKISIRRVVEVAHPERIILFGSAARGEMDSNSDVDLLVIKGGEYDHGSLLADIYVNLVGVRQAVEVILVTPEQVEKYRDVHCLIIKPALREGKEVYRALSSIIL